MSTPLLQIHIPEYEGDVTWNPECRQWTIDRGRRPLSEDQIASLILEKRAYVRGLKTTALLRRTTKLRWSDNLGQWIADLPDRQAYSRKEMATMISQGDITVPPPENDERGVEEGRSGGETDGPHPFDPQVGDMVLCDFDIVRVEEKYGRTVILVQTPTQNELCSGDDLGFQVFPITLDNCRIAKMCGQLREDLRHRSQLNQPGILGWLRDVFNKTCGKEIPYERAAMRISQFREAVKQSLATNYDGVQLFADD